MVHVPMRQPRKAPCRCMVEPSVCYMCHEVVPRKRHTIALQPVPCDAYGASYHLRCAKLAQVPRHSLWICESCTVLPHFFLIYQGFAQRDFIESLVQEMKLTDAERLVPHPDYCSPRPISAFGVTLH